MLDRLGARIWTARAEAELRRIGGRRNPAGSALSEMESQIAVLVSIGHTNSEVAAALQISRKTVEWNLSKSTASSRPVTYRARAAPTE